MDGMIIDDLWILDEDRHPRRARSLAEWGEFFGSGVDHRRVARTGEKDLFVSTVFLGIDHGFGRGPPILFETIIFRNGQPDDTWRCSDWDTALIQHKKACEVAGFHSQKVFTPF